VAVTAQEFKIEVHVENLNAWSREELLTKFGLPALSLHATVDNHIMRSDRSWKRSLNPLHFRTVQLRYKFVR